ncbi:MAG: ATP-binding protein, partial [Bacillota bacterium]
MLTQPTLEHLRRMRLHGMAEAYLAQAQQPATQQLCFEERFGLLVDHAWTYRHNRRLARLLQQARLRMPACMEDIDYEKPRGLNRALLRTLASCEWVRTHQNILVVGPTGVGKTYLCCALAHQACRPGFTTRYYRVPRLLTELAMAKGDGSYPELTRQLAMSLTRFGGHPILETGEVANAGNKTTISAGVPGGSCPLGTRE